MAQSAFDFNEFKDKKLKEYLKAYCKPVMLRKAQAGIVLVDYKMAGKKIPCVFIPIKKKPEAMSIFKQIKKDKEHVLKKTGLVAVSVIKAADGKEEISLNIRKGGLGVETLKAKGSKLFESAIKMRLKVVGGAVESQAGTESAQSDRSKEPVSIKAIAQKTQAAFARFKTLLPALKSQTLSPEQTTEVAQISTQFEAFNQMLEELTDAQRTQLDKLIVAVQKAEAVIAKLQVPDSDNKADIINNDNEFSAEEKAAIQQLVKSIKEGFATVKQEVMPNIKANTAGEKDKAILGGLIDNIDRFEDNYEAAPQVVKDKMAKFKEHVSTQKGQLQAMINKLGAQAQQTLNAMLTPEQRREIMDTAKTEVAQILKELEELKALAA